MTAVRQMEAAPLAGGKWTQDGMFGDGDTAGEAHLALGNHAIQTLDIFHDLRSDLLGRGSAGHGSLRRLPSIRHIPEPSHEKSRPALLPAIAFGAGFSFANSPLQIPDRA